MNLHIRSFTDKDLDDIVELSLLAWAPIFESFEHILGPKIYPILYPNWRKSQKEGVETTCKKESVEVLVADLDERVVGFLAYELQKEKETGEVLLLAVHPAHQNQGIGTELNEVALQKMKAAGMKLAVVGTGGDEGHAPARRSYEKAGYTALPLVRYYKRLDDKQKDNTQHKASSSNDAEQELARLREYQEVMYYFLHVFCNHNIKTPTLGIAGLSKSLSESDSLTDREKRKLRAIHYNARQILTTLNTTLHFVFIERQQRSDAPYDGRKEMDLRPILMDSISLIQQIVEDENAERAYKLELAKTEKYFNITLGAPEPIEIKLDIPHTLPTVWSNPWHIREVVERIACFIMKQPLKTAVSFSATSDDRQVSVSMGYSSSSVNTYAWEQFKLFESFSTAFIPDTSFDTLFLYACWHTLRKYDGTLQVDIHDAADTSENPKLLVTFTLPVYSHQNYST